MAQVDFSDLIAATPKKGVVDFSDLVKGQQMPTNVPGFTAALSAQEALDAQDRHMAEIRAKRTGEEADAHAMSLTGRITSQGLGMGILGIPAVIGDAAANAAYGAKKLAAKTGVVDAPDPANYGLAEGHFPAISAASRLARAIPDKLGFDHPETPGERIVASVGEGALGALSGVGAGATLARVGAQRVGNFLTANPIAQTVSGAASGGAAQGATEAGFSPGGAAALGFLAGMTPMAVSGAAGRQTIDTVAGRRSAAAELLRRRANDPDAAISSAESARAVTPGYRIIGTEATRDPGIAAVAEKIEGWSNAAPEAGLTVREVKAANSNALVDGLDNHGGTHGWGATLRRRQNTEDAANIGALNLRTHDDIDVTGILGDLTRRATPTETNSLAVSRANAEMAGDLRQLTRPVMGVDADGNAVEVGRVANAEALHNLRTEFSSRAHRSFLGQGAPGANGSALYGQGREVGRVGNVLSDEIDAVTGGRYRTEFLEPSAVGRREADNSSYMEDFRQHVAPTGGDVNNRTWLSNVRSRADRKLPGGRNMTYNDVTPNRRQFLEGAADDIEQNEYSRIVRERGGLAQNRRDLTDDLEDVVDAGQGPIRKAFSPLAKALDLGANAGSRVTVPGVGFLMRAAGEAGRVRGSERHARLIRDVQNEVGASAADPAALAALMRTPRAYNPGPVESSYLALRRAGTLGAAQGFLANERAKRYR